MLSLNELRKKSLFEASSKFMIQLNEIPTRDIFHDVLFRMLFHDVIFEGLSKSGILSSIVFMGGTSLHRCYGFERFSEDLDFELSDPKDSKLNIFIDIGRYLKDKIVSLSAKYGIPENNIKVSSPNEQKFTKNKDGKPTIFKWVYSIAMPSRTRCAVKVEISNTTALNSRQIIMPKLQESVVESDAFPVRVKPLEDIWTDKAAAIFQRRQVKYRDFHDFKAIKDRLYSKNFGADQIIQTWNNMCQRSESTDDLVVFINNRINEINLLWKDDEYKINYWHNIERFLKQQTLDNLMNADFQNDVLNDIEVVSDKMCKYLNQNYSDILNINNLNCSFPLK